MPGDKWLEAGYTGVVAAEQLPNGEVALAEEAVKPPVPTCFSTTAYTTQSSTGANGTVTVTATPFNPQTSTTPGG